MSTRGLIGIKQKNGSIRYIYNHHDSYPAYLMKEIYLAIKEYPLNKLQADMESGEWNNSDMTNITGIDYLWHEFVYIIDFDKKKWSAYQTKADVKDNMRGKLMPLMENIKFGDALIFATTKGSGLYKIIKVKKIIKDEPNYVVVKGEDEYYLVDKNDEFISSSKSKKDILQKAISEKI